MCFVKVGDLEKKQENEEILKYNKKLLDLNLETLHNKGALFYGISYMKEYKNKLVVTYYYYNLKEKKIFDIKVIFKKKNFNIYDPKFLIFKFDNKTFFNKKVKWKLLKFKTILKRIINYNNLYNNYKYETAFLYKEASNVENIEELYQQHLENIKLQILKIYKDNDKLEKKINF